MDPTGTTTAEAPAPSYRPTTPVVLLVFNRPDVTRRTFERIAAVEPERLLIVAGGPREDHPGDEALCRQTRAVIADIDWECDVDRLYYDTNQGRRDGVVKGLDWVFEQVPEAIILEDDCVAGPDFFRFCEDMLEEYRGDERVMLVNGTNRLGTWKADGQDYHFVTWQGVWGIGMWRSTWAEYDPAMARWNDPDALDRMRDVMCDEEIYERQVDAMQKVVDGRSDMWTKPLRFAMAVNNALAVVPSKNLVSNIGFGEHARFTTDPENPLADLPRYELKFPLDRRDVVAPDREYKRICFERYRRPGRAERILSSIPRPILDAVPEPLRRIVADRLS